MDTTSFEIAQIKESSDETIKKAELALKSETGKDIVLVAWERK